MEGGLGTLSEIAPVAVLVGEGVLELAVARNFRSKRSLH
jgi:hypothetical protein